MDTVGPILLGVLALIMGSLSKIIMNWEEIGPNAPREPRGRALFNQLYFGPDLVLLATGMLISSKGIQTLLAAKKIPSTMGDDLPTYFFSLLSAFLVALLLTIVFWFIAGPRKYFPIGNKTRKFTDPEGILRTETVPSPFWWKGLFSREGCWTLLGGNFIGFSCIYFYGLFITSAF